MRLHASPPQQFLLAGSVPVNITTSHTRTHIRLTATQLITLRLPPGCERRGTGSCVRVVYVTTLLLPRLLRL